MLEVSTAEDFSAETKRTYRGEVKTVAATSPRCLQFLLRVGPIGGRESLFSARHDGASVKTKTPDAVFAARPEGTPLSQPRVEDGE